MKIRLSRAQRRRLLEAPRVRVMKRLKVIERQIEQALFDQIWDRAKRKMRGTRPTGKRIVVPAKLVRSYDKALADMMKELLRSGREIGKLRSKAYRKRIGKRYEQLARRIKELETPEEAIARSQTYRTTVYVTWVEKKVKQWVTDTTKKRFRRTINRAKLVMEEAIKEGWTRSQMRETMARQFEHYRRHELDRVITTEGTRAVNLGTYHYEQQDKMVIGWKVVVNYKGCPVCNSAQADGFRPREKMDGDHIPPLHPNCECTLEPVFYTERAAVEYLKGHPEKDPFSKAA